MTDEKKNAFTKDTIFSVTPAHLSKVNKITQAPPPITPVSGFGIIKEQTNKPHKKQEVFIPVDGVELMRQWAVDWKCLFDFARQGVLIPDEPKHIQRCIDYDFGMLSYYPPEEIDGYFSQWRYNPINIEKFEAEHPDIIEAWQKKVTTSDNKEQKQDDTEPTPAPQVEPQADNYFKRNGNGDYWTICFQGKESSPIKDVNGLRYIAYLLERPGTSIDSLKFYNIVTGNTSNKIIDESEAIGEGFNIGSRKQEINDEDATQAYWKQWQEYQDNIDNADDTPEGNMMKNENLQHLKELEKRLKEKNFDDEQSKKQTLIHGLLNTAYKNIKADRTDHNMKKCADYLKKQIKTDGALGYRYTGEIKWQIFL